MPISGNVATDGYGLNAEEIPNVPTAGYGAGVAIQLGGAVVTEAERLLVDFETLEALVADVEDALAPVVELLITEIEAELTLTTTETLTIAATDVELLEVDVTETILAVDAAESTVAQLTPAETPTTALDTDETEITGLAASDGPSATLNVDDDLSGKGP